MALARGPSLDCKRGTLIVCLTAATVLGVLYTYTLFEEVQIDDADAVPGTFADPSLKSVTVLFRHGERAPVYDFINYPNIYKDDFPEGRGNLTKIGKQHMYQKGKLLRRLYNRFVDDVYLDREIIAKSTTISRTFMSAAMVMTGMYPPKFYQEWSDSDTVWQPIPIYNQSPDRTAIFHTHKCPYTTYFIKKDYDNIITSENKKEIEELLSYFTKKFGKPFNVEQIHILYDIIASRISNGFKLPKWIKPKFIKLMKSVNIEHLKRMYGNKKIQKLISGPLLKEISLNMELRTDNSNFKTTKNMYLYGGHDLTLGTVMYFLGINSIITPDYGASIHFHLYLDKNVGYIIKVFYYHKWDDEKGEEMLIPTCGSPCGLEEFTRRINYHFSTDWEKECKEMES